MNHFLFESSFGGSGHCAWDCSKVHQVITSHCCSDSWSTCNWQTIVGIRSIATDSVRTIILIEFRAVAAIIILNPTVVWHEYAIYRCQSLSLYSRASFLKRHAQWTPLSCVVDDCRRTTRIVDDRNVSSQSNNKSTNGARAQTRRIAINFNDWLSFVIISRLFISSEWLSAFQVALHLAHMIELKALRIVNHVQN